MKSLLVTALILIPASVALGAQPSYDCAKAQGTVEAPPPVSYSCGDFDLTAAFYRETDPPTAVLTLPGGKEGADQAIVYVVRSGSGARYQGHGVDFWEHQGEVMLDWHGKEMTCKVPRGE
jgi:uncharacterized protein